MMDVWVGRTGKPARYHVSGSDGDLVYLLRSGEGFDIRPLTAEQWVIIQVPPKHGMSNAILATPKWFPEGESVEPTEECPRPTRR